jgi:hypothetical protein
VGRGYCTNPKPKPETNPKPLTLMCKSKDDSHACDRGMEAR